MASPASPARILKRFDPMDLFREIGDRMERLDLGGIVNEYNFTHFLRKLRYGSGADEYALAHVGAADHYGSAVRRKRYEVIE